MGLSPGHHLGPYEVLAPIGAGGMGEVYRARDTRLGREVAVKVLPEHVALDSEALARFEREARTVAGLNDAHVCSLFDVGTEGYVHYAVFELLEGETVRERLSHGALPASKAIELAMQMCQGLAAAHAKGIVHRDLKPENLFLTRKGLKILDFGLAKLQPVGGAVTGEEGFSKEQTLSAQEQLTSPGTAPGTAAYMSPEQARGELADARSDIFAVGVVLYETLSGRRPFRRGTWVETLAAILKEDPPELASSAGPVSPGLERIVRRCLEKDPEDRFQSARDVTFALEAVSGASKVSDLEAEGRRRPWRPRRWMMPTLAVGAVAALLVLADRLWLRPPGRARAARVVRSYIDLPSGTQLAGRFTPKTVGAVPGTRVFGPPGTAFRTQLTISPDGTRLVWTGSPDGSGKGSALYVRALDTGEVRGIPGTEEATQPFFSPDGRWIGYFSKGWLRKAPVEGGLAVDLAEFGQRVPIGASWAGDGRIFLGSTAAGIRWIPAEGGPLRELTTVDHTREMGHRLPTALPDGRAVLFTTTPHVLGVRTQIEAYSVASGERKTVVENGADARYLPTGHLVFVRQGVLMAAPFDLARLELKAPPVPVVKGLQQALNLGPGSNSGAAQFAVSGSGLLVYASGGIFVDPPLELALVDETGRAEPLPGFDKPLVSLRARFSPDGRQLAFVEKPRSGLLWLFDLERHTHRALSQEGLAAIALWSPDGRRLVVTWSRAGPLSLWSLPVDGRGEWERLTESRFDDWAMSWSPDGRVLAFVRGGGPSPDILLYRFEDRQVQPFLTTKAREYFPAFSPDGRWLAYVSNESGRPEVYVTSFPDRKQTQVVSPQGGYEPIWSPDGNRLFYESFDDQFMMTVTVGLGDSLSLGRPRRLFSIPANLVHEGPWRTMDLHPDGRRFLFARGTEQDPGAPMTRLHLVHNWFAELERLAPTGR